MASKRRIEACVSATWSLFAKTASPIFSAQLTVAATGAACESRLFFAPPRGSVHSVFPFFSNLIDRILPDLI
jgi:hypothetical protein